MSAAGGGPSGPSLAWGTLRSWDGSQHRAFEELCYQLREPAQDGWITIKTGNPDGGVEWYDQAPDGQTYGGQAKYTGDIDSLIPLAKASLVEIADNRSWRNITKITFYAPFDMPDAAERQLRGKPVKSARQRWNEAVERWHRDIEGISDVAIAFVGAGELNDRLNEPGNSGRRWFFFQERFLGAEWCREQLAMVEYIASERYTPQHHVDLPIRRVLEGLAASPGFLRRLRARVAAISDAALTAAEDWRWWARQFDVDSTLEKTMLVAVVEPELLAATDTLSRTFIDSTNRLVTEVAVVGPESGVPTANLRDELVDIDQRLRAIFDNLRQISAAIADVPDDEPDDEYDRQNLNGTTVRERFSVHVSKWGLVTQALDDASGFLWDDGAQAAEAEAWLLLGEAGQGKTHTLVRAAGEALQDRRLAVTILGEQLRGEDVLSEIIRHLGLGGEVGHDEFLQALDAAGAASSGRFLLIVDALNDSGDPTRWKSQLPLLLSKVAKYSHVAVAVSCRTTLADVVLKPETRKELPCTYHPGFFGHEIDAVENYFRDTPQAVPRVPLLQSSFSNPLFVKFYATTVSDSSSADSAPDSLQQRSAVFQSFLNHCASRICDDLKLDPSKRPVHEAIDALAQRMATTGHEVIDWEEARRIVDAFAPAATGWPATMLGKLTANGVITTNRYFTVDRDPQIGVSFAYQALGDDFVVRSALRHFASDVETLRSDGRIPEGSGLYDWLSKVSPNLIEAATILLPELTGRELVHALGAASSTAASGFDRQALFGMFVNTLPLRSTTPVTQDSVDLVNQALDEFDLQRSVMHSVLAVTAEPGHPLNADRLHKILSGMPTADRDAWWIPLTWDALQGPGPLHRLVRWAEQLPTPPRLCPSPPKARVPGGPRHAGVRIVVDATVEPPKEVVRLAATTLTWCLASSNRFLRDRATKALTQLLLGFPEVLEDLGTRFLNTDAAQVNDTYVFTRLATVTYGHALRVGHSNPAALTALAEQILTYVFGDANSPAHASRSALLCEAARGIVDVAVRAGLVSAERARATDHPHPAASPASVQVPDENQLDVLYPVDRDDPARSWSTLHRSLTGMADFRSYEVSPVVNDISMLSLDTPLPERRNPHDQRLGSDNTAISAFRDSLPVDVRETLGSGPSIQRLLDQTWVAHRALTDTQLQLLNACAEPTPHDVELINTTHDEHWAGRWIFARTVELGWTPQLFGGFDSDHGYDSGRGSHKRERIGKKYQWMALHELGERLVNQYHVKDVWSGTGLSAVEGWQVRQRDIDPSLPPATHPLRGRRGRARTRGDHARHSPTGATRRVLEPADPKSPRAR